MTDQIQFTGTREEFLAKAREMMTDEDALVNPLVWSDPAPPTEGLSFYNHCFADSPIGQYRLEWKSWKGRAGGDGTDAGVSVETDLGYVSCEYSLADAKAAAQADFESRILSALQTPHKAKT